MNTGQLASRWGIAGHDEVIAQLDLDARSGRPSHAYLFTGPAGVGRTSTALAYVRALNCEQPVDFRPCGACDSCRRIGAGEGRISHPDVTLADLEWQLQLFGRSGSAHQRFSIEAVRWLRQNIGTRPVAGRWKVQIIDDADRFSEVAPDAFLKTLEEPPPYGVIILISSSAEAVSETIRSRCRQISFGLSPKRQIEATLLARGVDEQTATRIAVIARGRMAVAIGLAADPDGMLRRTERVNEAFEHVTSSLERLRIAGSIASNHTRFRERTFALLDTYAGLWRDALLIRTGLNELLTYPEVEHGLREYTQDVETRELYQALRATCRCMSDLDANFQARVALQAMVLQWPE